MLGTAVVVDDDRLCRMYCAHVLRVYGYRVVEARDARHGLALLDASEPCIVVCDLRLPDPERRNDLFAACARPAGRALPLPLVVVSADDARAAMSLAPRFAVLLCKPFTPDALLAAVNRALGAGGGCPERGVREAAAPERLAEAFRSDLRAELDLLDRNVTGGDWDQAANALHRLRGAAAMTGHAEFAERCRRMATCLAGSGPLPGWADHYVALLRLGESLASMRAPGRTPLRRRE